VIIAAPACVDRHQFAQAVLFFQLFGLECAFAVERQKVVVCTAEALSAETEGAVVFTGIEGDQEMGRTVRIYGIDLIEIDR